MKRSETIVSRHSIIYITKYSKMRIMRNKYSSQRCRLQCIAALIVVTVVGVMSSMTTTDAFQIPPPLNLNPLSARVHVGDTMSTELRVLPPSEEYDLTVIGAGPVGVRAAIVAASPPYLKKVCLVDAPGASGVLVNDRTGEDLSIGGPTGLFSKALRDVSKRVSVTTLRGMGLRDDSVWNEVTSACIDLATSNARDMRRQLSFSGVDYVEGMASFTGRTGTELMIQNSGKPSVTYNDDSFTSIANNNNNNMGMGGINRSPSPTITYLRPKNVLVATGSTPFRPPGIPFDGNRIFDSDSINGLSFLPKSVAITGSGIIAIEYAKIFRNLGADVTLIIRDKSPRNALIKIGLDRDVAGTLVADLVRSGIKFERSAQVSSFDVPGGGAGSGGVHDENVRRMPLKITLEGRDGQPRRGGGRTELLCDAYVAAVGREAKTSGLNLPSVGVRTDDYGNLMVNGRLESSVPHVYAAGDVLGRPFLASTGVAQGVAAVEAMFGSDKATVTTSKTALMCEEGDLECEESFAGLCIDGDLGRTGVNFDPKSLASNPFAFPVGVWSSPEAAYYGLSIQQAQELGIDAKEGIALYAECLRGQVFSPNGLLKIVFENSDTQSQQGSDGRILGVHICGDDACELIHYGMELVRAKRTLGDVVSNMYSAVTYHELYRIAAMAGLDEAGARKRRAAAGKALAARNRNKVAEGNY